MIIKYFLTNSVETRTDPDQLLCHKPASLDLCWFKEIYLRRKLKVGECCPGSAGSCFVETTSYPLSTYKYINFYIKILAMYVPFLLSSSESTVTIQQGDFDRRYTCYM